jgi:hypothetical protein
MSLALPPALPGPIIREFKGHNPMSIYTDNGYTDRAEYLDELREEYGELVDILITVLPASEDFDGLVSELEDAAYSHFELIGA